MTWQDDAAKPRWMLINIVTATMTKGPALAFKSRGYYISVCLRLLHDNIYCANICAHSLAVNLAA